MTKQEKLNQETEAWMKEHDDILKKLRLTNDKLSTFRKIMGRRK